MAKKVSKRSPKERDIYSEKEFIELLERMTKIHSKLKCKNPCIQNTLVHSYLKSATEWLRRIEDGTQD